MTMAYLLLLLIWCAWCALHSLMISLAVTERLRRRFPGGFRYYRLFYNLVAVTTLVPVLLYSHSLRGETIFAWHGGWRIVPILLWGMAITLAFAGGRRYDALQVLGLRQIRKENSCSVLTDDCTLDTSGVLSWVRHPWYSAGLLVVWARPLDLAALFTNLVVCGYFIIGALLEERKLVRQFGDQYREYRRRVDMFFLFAVWPGW
jgi:protein-S-isoprenylcysteine O-methyltransferase Ste14